MSDYTHQSQSSAGENAFPDVVAPEVNHPDLNDPMEDQDLDSFVSDCESVITTGQSSTAPEPFNSSGLMEVHQREEVHRAIEERFVSRLHPLGVPITVVAIHQNRYSSAPARALAQAFQANAQAVQKKVGSDTANMSYGWRAISKEEVFSIFSDGFGSNGRPNNSGLYGCGLYLAPEDHLIECINVAPRDEDGLRHLVLCRVILGKSELIHFGSQQCHPSSEQYDSGVDDLLDPRRYIIWTTHMNTHVLPQYIISFKAPCFLGGLSRTPKKSRSISPRGSFGKLFSELLETLPPSEIFSIHKCFMDHKWGKISKRTLLRRVKQKTGERLLTEIIKTFEAK